MNEARELDYWIADHLIGLAVEKSGYHDGFNYSTPLRNGRTVLRLPAFSTDIAAWEDNPAALYRAESSLGRYDLLSDYTDDLLGRGGDYRGEDLTMRQATTLLTLSFGARASVLMRYARLLYERHVDTAAA